MTKTLSAKIKSLPALQRYLIGKEIPAHVRVQFNEPKKKRTALLSSSLFVEPPSGKYNPGSVGLWLEDEVEQFGFPVDRKTSKCDTMIHKCSVELKARCIEASSPQQIGSMSGPSIILTPWECSPLKDKIQIQFRVMWSKITGRVVSAKIVDFTSKELQEQLRLSYENCRAIIAARQRAMLLDNTITLLDYVRVPGDIAYFEIKGTSSYLMRIDDAVMRGITSPKNQFDAIIA